MKVGILGTGRIADRFLAPALRRVENATLWSVLSRDLQRGKDFAASHGAASPQPAYDDLEKMLSDKKLDAVIIATPDGLHAEQTILAAKHGKHVFVEKPMAIDKESAAAMVKACSDAGVKLGVAYHLRWHAGHRQMVARVRGGELGTLRHMRAQWTYHADDAKNWRAQHSVGRWWGLAGVGTHCLDLVRWVMTPTCGEVVETKALISKDVWKGPHDETAVVLLRFDSGATAEITTSVLFESASRVEIYGSEGTVECKGTLGPHGGGRIRFGSNDLKFSRLDPYQAEIADFISSIEQDRQPEVDGPEGQKNIEILLQADPR